MAASRWGQAFGLQRAFSPRRHKMTANDTRAPRKPLCYANPCGSLCAPQPPHRCGRV